VKQTALIWWGVHQENKRGYLHIFLHKSTMISLTKHPINSCILIPFEQFLWIETDALTCIKFPFPPEAIHDDHGDGSLHLTLKWRESEPE